MQVDCGLPGGLARGAPADTWGAKHDVFDMSTPLPHACHEVKIF